jgi:glycosyltransferase involved in cell wall biosynthesis
VRVASYTFADDAGFSGAYNETVDRADADWSFLLDADERIDADQAPGVRDLCEQGEAEGIDCFGIPRRNWFDLARTGASASWPDRQWRLFRRGVRFIWRVHSYFHGSRRSRAVEPDLLTIQHFNFAFRNQADWDRINAEYDRLLALDVADGRNWGP